MRRVFLAALLAAACSNGPAPDVAEPPANSVAYEAHSHDAARALASLRTLSSDEMEGRKTGEPGNLKAQAWLGDTLEGMGVPALHEDGYGLDFSAPKFNEPGTDIRGTNYVAWLAGPENLTDGSPIIVLSAHYDHLGIGGDDVYNGADDNASGVAALIETIAWFQAHPPESTLVFIFFDAEEDGIAGSAAWLDGLSSDWKERIALNLNLDMVARADKGELYAVGGFHFPELVPLLDSVAADAPLTLLQGHDSPEWGAQDWSVQSDHAPFLRSGIPFIYLGVEDHADYHEVTDEFERIDPDMFARSVDTIIMVAEAADKWVAAQAR